MSLLSRMNAAANEEASLQQSLAYDYSRVAEANRPAIIAAALEIKPRLKRASEDLVEVGKQLNAVKGRLPHGAWEDWLNEEFALTVRTAQNFMNVADRFDGKSEIISLLSSTVAYQLAAPSTPAAAVAEVVAIAQASGKRPSVAETKAAIAKHKPEREIEYAPASVPATVECNQTLDPAQLAEIEGLIALYSEAHKKLSVFSGIMGYHPHGAETNIAHLIGDLKEKLRGLV